MRELIIDNFAGGGGASTGIELATGRSPDIAINHDPAAVAMHKVNHPDTLHYLEDVWEVDPRKVTNGRPVALCWLSPDCKHFSKAKGGKPVEKKIRGLAWVAVRWAATVKPRVIMLENVEEFKTWGPLLKDGKPDPKQKGRTFSCFVNALKRQGYKVETKEIRACDYGAPTIRKRFFLIARCDGQLIVWPKPTHGDPNSPEVKSGKLKPWCTAAECIDWSIPCPSIFERKKPLAENTMRRIARGIQKFVIDNPNPFIMQIGQSGFMEDRSYSLDKPLTTIVTKAEHCLITPTLMVNNTGHPGSKVDEPARTITTGGHHALVVPTLIQYHTETAKHETRGQAIDKPIMTLDTSPRYGLVTSFLAKHYGGNYTGPGSGLEKPLPTVTTVDHNALVAAFIAQHYGTSTGHEVEHPLNTVTGVNKASLVTAFLKKYSGQECSGLVTIHGQDYQIVDIGMRMLEPRELFDAQGFPHDYTIDVDYYGRKYPKSAQVARCGNAVPPPFAGALVKVNLPELCGIKQLRLDQAQMSLF